MDAGEEFGSKLWRNAKTTKKVLVDYIAALPGAKNFNDLPSGKGLRDVLKKAVVIKYKEHHAKTAAAAAKKNGCEAVGSPWVGVYSDIPATWWLENLSCSFFLALMVHRGTSIVSMTAATAPSGGPRHVLRNEKKKEEDALRAAASAKRKEDARVAAAPDPLDGDYKKARVDGLKSMVVKTQADALHTRIGSAMTHVQLLNSVKDSLPASEYKQQILSIVRACPKTFSELEQESANVGRKEVDNGAGNESIGDGAGNESIGDGLVDVADEHSDDDE